MKKLYIIDDRRPLWRQIALMLEEINAEVHILTHAEAAKVFEEERPDLLILGEDSRPVVTPPDRDLTRLVVSDDIAPGNVIRSREGRNVVKLGWPADRAEFFELTRRILCVPERRPYRTPVLVLTRPEGRSVDGKSEDFSLSGMAFRSKGVLARDEMISVAFGAEGKADGLRLEAVIVRSTPGRPGEATLYGVRFEPLSPANRHALERFVWRINRRSP